MKIHKSKFILLIFFGAIFCLILVKFLAIISIPENKNIVRVMRTFPTQDSGYDKTQPATLYPSKPVQQKIAAGQNNLSQINIAFENYPGRLDDKIILSIGDADCRPLYSKTIGYFSFWIDPIYTRFKFPKIADSKDKTYCLQAEFKAQGERINDFPRISTFRSAGESYFNSNDPIGKTRNNTSLIFKSAYAGENLTDNLNSLLNRISQYKPSFLKGAMLAVVLFLSFISIIFLILLFILIL